LADKSGRYFSGRVLPKLNSSKPVHVSYKRLENDFACDFIFMPFGNFVGNDCDLPKNEQILAI